MCCVCCCVHALFDPCPRPLLPVPNTAHHVAPVPNTDHHPCAQLVRPLRHHPHPHALEPRLRSGGVPAVREAAAPGGGGRAAAGGVLGGPGIAEHSGALAVMPFCASAGVLCSYRVVGYFGLPLPSWLVVDTTLGRCRAVRCVSKRWGVGEVKWSPAHHPAHQLFASATGRKSVVLVPIPEDLPVLRSSPTYHLFAQALYSTSDPATFIPSGVAVAPDGTVYATSTAG